MSSAVRLYASADGRSLGLFRIVLGLLLCADVAARFGLVDALYANEGVLTNHFALYRPVAPQHWSLFYALSAARDVRVAVGFTGLACVLFTVGYRTRLTGVLALLSVVSLHARNLLAEVPSDAVLHAWLLWALLLPVGERWSLDSVFRGAVAAPQEGELEPAPLPTSRTQLAVFGAQLWLAAMHAAITLQRTGPSWREGRALGDALSDGGRATALGRSLAHASDSTLSALSYFGWISPLVIAVLVLLPFVTARRAAIAYLALYHLGSSLLFRDALSSWALCAAAPLLVSGEDWQRWARFRASVLPRLVVIYDADCGVCFLICRWLHRLDAYDRLGFLPNDSPAVPSSVSSETLASTVVVIGDRDERVLTRAAAVAAIVGVLPAGRPLSWLLGRAPIAALADGAYQRFAARRAAVSQWLGFDACGLGGAGPSTESSVPSTEPASRAPRVVADAAALVLALLCGAGLLRGGAVGASAHVSPLDVAVRYARLAPAPDRLSPDPPRWSGALVVEGVTASGAHLDPLTQRPPRASPLDDPSAETEGALLLAYFERVSEPRHAVYLDGLREYVKRAAVRGDPRQRVTSFVLVWLTVPLGAAGEDGAASGPTRTELGAYP